MTPPKSRYSGIDHRGGAWRARWRDETGTRRALSGFPTEKAAHDFRTAALEQVRLARIQRKYLPNYDDGTAGEITIGELWEEWYTEYQRRVSLSTARGALSHYRNHIETRFAHLPVGAVTVEMVTSWQHDLEERWRGNSVRHFKRLLRQIIDQAGSRYPMKNPVGMAPKVRSLKDRSDPRVPTRVLTVIQFAALYEAFDPRWQAMLLTGVESGTRPGELYGLKRSDFVTTEEGRVLMSIQRRLTKEHGVSQTRVTRRLKGEPESRASRRTVEVPGGVLAAVDAHLDRYGPATDGLIFSMPEGSHIDISNFRRPWGQAVAAAGIPITDDLPKPAPYSLRHTHGSMLLAAGWSPADAAQRMGHKRQSTLLDFYSHTFPDGSRPQPGDFLAAVTGDTDNVVDLRAAR